MTQVASLCRFDATLIIFFHRKYKSQPRTPSLFQEMIGFLIHNEDIFVFDSYSNSYASTGGPPLMRKSLTGFPLPRFLAYLRASVGFLRQQSHKHEFHETRFSKSQNACKVGTLCTLLAPCILSESNLHNSNMKIKFNNTLAFSLSFLDFH